MPARARGSHGEAGAFAVVGKSIAQASRVNAYGQSMAASRAVDAIQSSLVKIGA